MEKRLKIGTLNLNGETWNLNNKSPRLPKDLFNPEVIKEGLTHKTQKGILKLLEKEYDIIAVQELVRIDDHYEKIEKSINEKGYELISPQSLGGNIHFTVAFIIKKEYRGKYETYSKNTVLGKYEGNRIMALDFNINDVEFTIINMHLPNNKKTAVCGILDEIDEEITKENKKVILLGDFNAFTEEQNEKGRAANYREYVDIFIKGHDKDPKYTECGNNKQYTYYTSNGGSKLDHIFVSNSIIDSGLCEKEPPLEIDDTVNFHVVKNEKRKNDESGFTDHSMLTLHLMV